MRLLTICVLIGSLFLFNFEISGQEGGGSNVPNTISISEEAGITTYDYPIQIGRPFKQGEISQFPQAVVDGLPVPTQADVKCRWPDGSVKHAILSFLIPKLKKNSTLLVSFQNYHTGNNAAYLKEADMLDSQFDFNAWMQLTSPSGGEAKKVAARFRISRS